MEYIPDIQARFETSMDSPDYIADTQWIIEKANEFPKVLYLFYWLYKAFLVCRP